MHLHTHDNLAPRLKLAYWLTRRKGSTPACWPLISMNTHAPPLISIAPHGPAPLTSRGLSFPIWFRPWSGRGRGGVCGEGGDDRFYPGSPGAHTGSLPPAPVPLQTPPPSTSGSRREGVGLTASAQGVAQVQVSTCVGGGGGLALANGGVGEGLASANGKWGGGASLDKLGVGEGLASDNCKQGQGQAGLAWAKPRAWRQRLPLLPQFPPHDLTRRLRLPGRGRRLLWLWVENREKKSI